MRTRIMVSPQLAWLIPIQRQALAPKTSRTNQAMTNKVDIPRHTLLTTTVRPTLATACGPRVTLGLSGDSHRGNNPVHYVIFHGTHNHRTHRAVHQIQCEGLDVLGSDATEAR